MRSVSRVALLGGGILGSVAAVHRGTRWGSTPEEQAREIPGDDYVDGGPPVKTAMTRAISISAPPETVWPWLAQMGRGAGWYSWDRIDNGGRQSARHIVTWIPEPQVGDASAIGWLRNIDPGTSLTWWVPGEDLLGLSTRLVASLMLTREGAGSRLVIRMTADAEGRGGRAAMYGFEVVDSIMAIRQLYGIKSRAELYGTRTEDPDAPETGARDQYQLYETIWASGKMAGTPGKEKAAMWSQAAEDAGVLTGISAP